MKKETALKKAISRVNKEFPNESQKVKDYIVGLIMRTYENLEMDPDAEHYTSTQNLETAFFSNLVEDREMVLEEGRRESQKSQKEKLEGLLNRLSSAYQENSITGEIDNIKEYAYTRQEFADACCETYRETLKGAGYGGDKVYKGFRDYGDETELQDIAYQVYDLITNSENADQKGAVPIIKSKEEIRQEKAAKIIKNKRVDVGLFYTVLEDANQTDKLWSYNFWCDEKTKLTKREFNLVKEFLQK